MTRARRLACWTVSLLLSTFVHDRSTAATGRTSSQAVHRAQQSSSSSSAPSSSSASPAPSRPPRLYAGGIYVDGDCPRQHPRCIALTFDDGPDAPLTSRLLDILDQHHLHATFFVEGQNLDGTTPEIMANRAVLLEARRRGHYIGNHTYHHWVLDRLNDAQLAYEFDRTAQLITEVLGEQPGFFRAPYGILGTRRDLYAAVARDYTIVRWRLDPRDWAVHTADAVLRNFRYQLYIHPQGGILLMHDVHPSTIDAVPLVLDEIEHRNEQLRARGEAPYEFVTLDAFYRSRHPRARPAPTH